MKNHFGSEEIKRNVLAQRLTELEYRHTFLATIARNLRQVLAQQPQNIYGIDGKGQADLFKNLENSLLYKAQVQAKTELQIAEQMLAETITNIGKIREELKAVPGSISVS